MLSVICWLGLRLRTVEGWANIPATGVVTAPMLALTVALPKLALTGSDCIFVDGAMRMSETEWVTAVVLTVPPWLHSLVRTSLFMIFASAAALADAPRLRLSAHTASLTLAGMLLTKGLFFNRTKTWRLEIGNFAGSSVSGPPVPSLVVQATESTGGGELSACDWQDDSILTSAGTCANPVPM